MKVFLLNKAPTDIARLLREANMSVWTNLTDVSDDRVRGFTWNALERVDAIILEISYSAQELQYILAQAIVLQKPTLCLYPKNREPRDLLTYLQKPTVPKSVVAKCYTSTTLNELLTKFLQKIDHSVQLEESPNIKFTLRLTPAIERYLNWLAQYQGANKAEYIRKIIKEKADSDNHYQQLF